jgi:hypothetical protein
VVRYRIIVLASFFSFSFLSPLVLSFLATKVRLFLSSLPPSSDSPALAEAWFWHRYKVLSRDPDWELILVGDFNRS